MPESCSDSQRATQASLLVFLSLCTSVSEGDVCVCVIDLYLSPVIPPPMTTRMYPSGQHGLTDICGHMHGIDIEDIAVFRSEYVVPVL